MTNATHASSVNFILMVVLFELVDSIWVLCCLWFQIFRDRRELIQGRLQIGGDVRLDHCSLSMRSTMSRRNFAGSWILFCALGKITLFCTVAKNCRDASTLGS